MDGFSELLQRAGDFFAAFREPEVHSTTVWILAIILAGSALVKLRHPGRAALAMADFGLVREPRRGFGVGAGVVEASISASVGVVALADSGDSGDVVLILTAALLWLFVTLLVRALRSGQPMACMCFDDSDEIRPATAWRTGAIAALATVLALAPRGTGTAESWNLALAELVLAVVLVATVVLLLRVPRLLRLNREPFAAGPRARRAQ